MSKAFEILSAALNEAIADAKNPQLKRQFVSNCEKKTPINITTSERTYMKLRAAALTRNF